MVDAVMDLVAAPGVLYAVILVLLTLDAFVPVVPAQALMIGGGILSTTGHVQLLLLVAAGALGAVSGDLLAFLLGRRLARRDAGTPDRLTRRKPRAMTLRLNEAMRKHIFLAVLLCRFVPAGRMITAIYAGRNGVSTRRFATYDVVAATLWASYGALLGHFGGEAIADSSWLPLTLVAAAALLFLAAAPLLGLAGKLRKRSARTAQPAVAVAFASEPVASSAVAVAFASEPVALSAVPAQPAAAEFAVLAGNSPVTAETDTLVSAPTRSSAGLPLDGSVLPANTAFLVTEPAPTFGSVVGVGTVMGAESAVGARSVVGVGAEASGGSAASDDAKSGRATRGAFNGRRANKQPVAAGTIPVARVGLVARVMRAAGSMPVVAAAPQQARRRCRRTAMETLAAAEPMAAIEVLVAAEAVAAAESVVVQVNGLQNAN